MQPDDKRHGSNAGYVAGCRSECCQRARIRQQKMRRALNYAGRSAWATREQADLVVKPWREMGFYDAAILRAAGLCNDHVFTHDRILSSTLEALTKITEDKFHENATVPTALTYKRIYSLQAAGHRLKDIPINDRGQWRYRDRIRVGFAREVREYYRENEFKIGTSKLTASRARNAGHQPPLAWDDPGTLAWPNQTARKTVRSAKMLISKDIDPVVVQRFIGGDTYLHTTPAEKREIVRLWPHSHAELARLTGWKPERYIDREDGAA